MPFACCMFVGWGGGAHLHALLHGRAEGMASCASNRLAAAADVTCEWLPDELENGRTHSGRHTHTHHPCSLTHTLMPCHVLVRERLHVHVFLFEKFKGNTQ